MASGANNTARQLGLATGTPVSVRIFQSKIESTLTPLVAGTPASSHVHEFSRAVASGGTGRALQAVPPADRDKVVAVAHHEFVTGFGTVTVPGPRVGNYKYHPFWNVLLDQLWVR
jgi:hypothetical protein